MIENNFSNMYSYVTFFSVLLPKREKQVKLTMVFSIKRLSS